MGKGLYHFEDRRTGFFVINFSRWCEFGFACGKLNWSERYMHYLIFEVQKALKGGADVLYPKAEEHAP